MGRVEQGILHGHRGARAAHRKNEYGFGDPRMNRLIQTFVLGLLAALSVIAGICPLDAQEETDAMCKPNQSMRVGKACIVDLREDAAEIFVANPKVANAVVRSPRKLYVIGMDAGKTSIFALNQQGSKIADLDLDIGPYIPAYRTEIDIRKLQQTLRAVMPTAAITARAVNGSIILIGTVDSAEDAQRAADIAKVFLQPATQFWLPTPGGSPAGALGTPGASGNVPVFNLINGAGNSPPMPQPVPQQGAQVINMLTIRGRAQVMLKVTVAEVDREVLKQLGITTSSVTVNWGVFNQFNPFPLNGVIASAPVPSVNPLATAAQNGTATALTAHNPSNTLSATLQAFERYGVTRILPEPTVSAISGESAKLFVGGEIPIPGPTTCSGQQGGCTGGGAIFQPYGITLGFTPIVLAEGRIELHLSTAVTEIDTQTAATVYGTLVPGLLTCQNETTVELPSGGSIASAGLLSTISRQAINGLPGLLDLPVLGALFRSNDYQRQETELMIVVTPTSPNPCGQMRSQSLPMALRTQAIRKRGCLDESTGSMPRPVILRPWRITMGRSASSGIEARPCESGRFSTRCQS
jgi:pilus assembly protein CpaC